jgi:hypothetical protein
LARTLVIDTWTLLPEFRAVDAERVSEGVIVEFHDIGYVLYSAFLLRSMLPLAVNVEEDELND